MGKLPVYCDYEYLKQFFSDFGNLGTYQYELNEEAENMLAVQRLFLSRCEFRIDLTNEEITARKQEPIIKMLIKRTNDGGSKLVSQSVKLKEAKEKKSESILENEFNSIYCLNIEEEKAKKIQEECGVYCFGQRQYPNLIRMQKPPIPIKPNKEFKWDDALNSNNPSQFLYLKDRFLIEKLTDSSKNLISILQSVSNDKYKGIFKIYVYHTIDDENLLSQKKKVFEEIAKKNIKQKHIINYKRISTDDNHDRDIVLSYHWIHCGHTFDILKDNSKTAKRTSIHFNNIFNETSELIEVQKDNYQLFTN